MLKPLGSRVVLEIIEESEQKTQSGLVLAGSAKETPQVATVVAVGPGERSLEGARFELSVQEGDVVVFEKYAGSEVSHDGKDYLVVKEQDIIAIVD